MRAKNMQALTDDVKRTYPGVVIYGVGDDAHKLRISDHNEDDTSGSKAAQSDSDNVPEHRAIDIMLGAHFSKANADHLVRTLLADQASRARLFYIIWNGSIWSRDNGWKRQDHTDDPHTDHIHVSGLASDDENDSPWLDASSLPSAPAPVVTIIKRGNENATVRRIQSFLREAFPAYRNYVTVKPGYLLAVDSVFGLQTEAWVKEFQRRTGLVQDGIVGPKTLAKLRQYGYAY